MRPCINQCGEVAEHGPYCGDCASERRTEKRAKPFNKGGYLKAGLQQVENTTGESERIFTTEQW